MVQVGLENVHIHWGNNYSAANNQFGNLQFSTQPKFSYDKELQLNLPLCFPCYSLTQFLLYPSCSPLHLGTIRFLFSISSAATCNIITMTTPKRASQSYLCLAQPRMPALLMTANQPLIHFSLEARLTVHRTSVARNERPVLPQGMLTNLKP